MGRASRVCGCIHQGEAAAAVISTGKARTHHAPDPHEEGNEDWKLGKERGERLLRMAIVPASCGQAEEGSREGEPRV